MSIHRAAFEGNINLIKEILESAPHQVNQILELKDGINAHKVTPLFFAVLSGHLEAFKILLNHNALIRSADESLELLKWSSYGKNLSKIGSILNVLSKQKDVHVSQLVNQSLEQFKTSSIALKTLMSQNNFDYNQDTQDAAYYFLAGFKGDMAHLKEIINDKCDPTTLSLIAAGAASSGKVEVVEVLHKEYNFNLMTPIQMDEQNKYTLAFIAAQFGHVNVLEYLYSEEFDLTAPLPAGTKAGITPAFIALLNNNLKVLEYLSSIQINLATPILEGQHKGFTLAYIAAERGNIEALKCLKTLGVNLAAPLSIGTLLGITPACIAAQSNYVDVLKYFYSIGIDLAAPLANGRVKNATIADIAAKSQACESLKYLHSIGVDLSKPILEGPHKGYTLASLAAQFDLVDSIKCLHSLGVNLAAPLSDGKEKGLTPAYFAAQKGHLKVLNFLSENTNWIEDGFHNHWKNLSPFHVALLTGKPQHVKAIVDFGISQPLTVNDLEDKEWSLIDFIGQAYQEKYVSHLEKVAEICQILIDNHFCNREELLQTFEKHNFNLFKALLTFPEKSIVELLSNEKFLKEVLVSSEILPQGKALMRLENCGVGFQLQSTDLADFIRVQIDMMLSKAPQIYRGLITKLEELNSIKIDRGYRMDWKDDQLEKVMQILNDLESATLALNLITANSEIFQHVVPATYTLIDTVDIPEEGMEVDFPST